MSTTDHDRRAGPVVRSARRLEVYGTVQGVGFRPFVYRLATSLGLDGEVRNDGGRVVISAAGAVPALEEFAYRLRADAPAHAGVSDVRVGDLGEPAPAAGAGFTVAVSTAVGTGPRDIPPDLATCQDCLRELFDPADRRYRYPFVNCTACGPRATIIDDLPYDRTRTVMAGFPLCAACAAEYADPADRRFHAEPVACPACGPRLAWSATEAVVGPQAVGEDALQQAVAVIRGGGIVALKGLGGYQLVCDATALRGVATLRERKRRPRKPFAVMVADLDAARGIAELDRAEERLLTSAAAPVVLVTARRGAGRPLAPGVHPGTDRVGLFVPYTPLHHLLTRAVGTPLVVTSGNRADEPIAVDDGDARETLAEVADGFLVHDRPIRARYDDSVAHVVAGAPALLRRARGYAPEPLALPVPAAVPLLAAGAQLKHTFTLAEGHRALVGPHTGDLSDARTLDAFRGTLAHLSRIEALEPVLVAHDLHPAYLSTQFATDGWAPARRIAVQHHHAHVASCAAEHGLTGRFIGVAYDGLGLGDDGTLWGGEVLVATLAGYRRAGRFATAPLPGGAAAVTRPARMALGYLFGLERFDTRSGERFPAEHARRHTDRLPARDVAVVRRMVERGVNSPLASSAGRLFDAVASLLGLCDDASYEGEAAVVLEAAARGLDVPALPWRLVKAGGLWVYDPASTLAAVLQRAAAGSPAGETAAAFQAAVVEVTAALVSRVATETGVRDVCLSGGCFQNAYLADRVPAALAGRGLRVYLNHRVPAGDGGISYGQAAIAAARTTRG